MPDEPLKSAYELAMERLKAKDRKSGVDERRPLTAKQKQEIARLRQTHKAKLAELEILHGNRPVGETDPEKLRQAEEHYRIDRERADAALASAIEKLKQGS